MSEKRENRVVEKQKNKIPVVWTIGASDSSGGSGIQADLLTFNDFLVHGCTAITALNAQNSFALGNISPTSGESFAAQISALEYDMPANSIKLGMMPNLEIARMVNEYLEEYTGFVVYDLELDNCGKAFLGEAKDLVTTTLFKRVDLVIANTEEVDVLSGINVCSTDTMVSAARYFLELGARSVLITGARIVRDQSAAQNSTKENGVRFDYWSDGTTSFWLQFKTVATVNNQSGGCALSAAVAAMMGGNSELKEAITQAKAYVTKGIRGARQIGNGPGTVAHLGLSDDPEDMPQVLETIE
ncbi:MAG: hydroxymethylpyrimidine kinase/phosphomethylpyrimidine kinase/thiamine-phosphate diphosphorylase [Oceanicoccus sp.]